MWNQGMFASSLKTAPSDNETYKVAWISQREDTYPGVKYLVDYLQAAGLPVTPVLPIGLGIASILDHQIILIEAGDHLDAALLRLAVGMLVKRFAVIVVLMDQPTSQQIIQALSMGADAVWTTEESGDVLRARASALLCRRLKNFRHPQSLPLFRGEFNTKI
jgi:hypothetical protein